MTKKGKNKQWKSVEVLRPRGCATERRQPKEREFRNAKKRLEHVKKASEIFKTNLTVESYADLTSQLLMHLVRTPNHTAGIRMCT